MRDSFIFYKEWKDAIADLPNDVRLEIYEAIIEYGTSGKLPTLKPIANVAFNFIKTKIDRNIEKYNEELSRRKEAGRRGGLAKASNASTTKQDQAEQASLSTPSDASSTKQSLANVAVYVHDNDIEENTTNVVSKKDAARAATLKRKEEFRASLLEYDRKYHVSTLSAFFEYWSELNKSGTKMLYEMKPTWELSKRLATWTGRERQKTSNADIGTVLHDNSESKYNETLW